MSVTFDAGKCTGCGECVSVCPVGLISKNDETGLPEITAEMHDNCLGCEHCYAVCPVGAVSIYDLDPEVDSIALNSEMYPDPDKVENLVRGRRSIRKYRQENVDRVLLDKLLLAAANCPTAGNNHSLRFDVIAEIDSMNEFRNEIMKDLIQYNNTSGFPQEAEYLGKFLHLWEENGIDVVFRTAPHLLVVSAPKDNPLCRMVDVSIGLSYFELLAQANGIGTTWCGLLRLAMELLPEYKSRLIGDDSGEYYCMLLGYPAVNYARTVNRDHQASIRYKQW